MARDVTDHEAEPAFAERDDVVPVAADVHVARRRDVPRRDLEPERLRDPIREQAALQRGRDAVLPLVQLELGELLARHQLLPLGDRGCEQQRRERHRRVEALEQDHLAQQALARERARVVRGGRG